MKIVKLIGLSLFIVKGKASYLLLLGMEENNNDFFKDLPKANPIQKRVPVPPRSIMPLLPLPSFKHS